MRIYRLKDVVQMTGLARSTLYRYIARGSFPKPVKLAPDDDSRIAVGWTESALQAWFDKLEGLRDVD